MFGFATKDTFCYVCSVMSGLPVCSGHLLTGHSTKRQLPSFLCLADSQIAGRDTDRKDVLMYDFHFCLQTPKVNYFGGFSVGLMYAKKCPLL